jgi:hypothetical protein
VLAALDWSIEILSPEQSSNQLTGKVFAQSARQENFWKNISLY